jgi:alpha-tubulin suppressor-like RCC1 family protein
MSITNVLLINSSISDYHIFVSSVNSSTLPIVYSSATTREEILMTLSVYTSIDRIGIVFLNESINTFIENETFFSEPLSPFSENMNFIISVIQQFSVTHIDYLACDTLNTPGWKEYYAILSEQTGVIVGASNNNTGNIAYGGDWVLESTGQDIEMIYFTQNIEYYTYLLDSISNFSIMMKQDNTIYFTGDNQNQITQIDTASNKLTLQPTVGINGLTPSSIALGNDHIVVLMNNNDIYVCGRNDNGQLNTGDLIYREQFILFQNTTGLTPKQIECGGLTTYILMNDASGSIYACGENNVGQLGLDHNITPITTLQQMLNTTGKIPKQIISGLRHLIVLMTDDTIYGTGQNSSGQLGIALGNITNQYTLQPIPYPSDKTLKKIVCGNTHTILLMTDNTIFLTGQNNSGQLGLGDFSNRSVMTEMTYTAGKTPTMVYSSYLSVSTYVLMTDDTLYATGENNLGLLGIGNNTDQNTLQLVINSTGYKPISVSPSARHVLIQMDDNSVYAAGENVVGQLGVGYTSPNSNIMLLMQNTTEKTPAKIFAGDRSSIILMNDNTIYSCGANNYGQLALGYSRYYFTYTQLSPFTYVPVMVEFGSGHMVVLTTTGIYGIGLNTSGQLGLGNTTSPISTFSLMRNTTGLTPIAIACGGSHTMVLMNDASGSIYGTGVNSNGQLGLGNTATPQTSLSTTTKMIIPNTVVPKAISCGTSYTLVLMTNGTIYGAGLNGNGQLGTTNLTLQSTPVIMVNTTGLLAYEIACGATHSIVLMNDASGSIYGTGLNTNGQLGLGNLDQQTSLSPTSKMINTTGLIPMDIACGTSHTVVLMNDASGSIYGTGLNTNGQLGLGNLVQQTSLSSTSKMINTTGLKPVAISCGTATTFVLMSNGSIYGTGLQNNGQLGLGFNTRFTTLTEITSVNSIRRLPSSNVYLNSPNVDSICFKKDSQILTDKGYVPIQNLRKGDLIKTFLNGYVPIHMIGKRDMYHVAAKNRINDQLYVCTSDAYPEVFEPLVLTGCHSILVDEYPSYEEREHTIKVNGNTYITEDQYRLPVCADKRSKIYDKRGIHTIYHMSLEHNDYFMNYGIYANGLLVETCSKRFLKELSNMEIL